MTRISVKDARGNFRKVLDQVACGTEVAIMRRGKEVARIVPPSHGVKRPFPSHKALRDSIKLRGEPLSKTVARMRREERY